MADLGGLTLCVLDPKTTHMAINGQELVDLQRKGPDYTGQRSVSLPWPKLEFPKI